MEFKLGRYPSRSNLAKVLQIFKSDSKTVPANYRQISLLSNINKIIEKAIYIVVYIIFLSNLIFLTVPSLIQGTIQLF